MEASVGLVNWHGWTVELIELAARDARLGRAILEHSVRVDGRQRTDLVEARDLRGVQFHRYGAEIIVELFAVRGPMIGMAPLAATQAMATWLGGAPISAATASSVSRMAVRCVLFSGWNTRPPKPAGVRSRRDDIFR